LTFHGWLRPEICGFEEPKRYENWRSFAWLVGGFVMRRSGSWLYFTPKTVDERPFLVVVVVYYIFTL
jgi:hypothetical protein